MTAQPLSILQRLYFAGFLAVLAILPMSHTTALRNVLLVALLALLVVHAYQQRHTIPDLLRTARPIPWALLAWCVFLLLFPLWAVYPQEAWANLRGQWGQSMLTWVIGFGAVWLLGRRGPGLWLLGLASAFPLVVHLLLMMLAWPGLLGSELPLYLSGGEIWSRLARLFAPGGLAVVAWQGFGLRFWGVEPMHGNLGYAACQAIALFSVLLLFSWRSQGRAKAAMALLAIGLSMVSILAASSRGAFLYAILVMLLAGAVYYAKSGQQRAAASRAPRRHRTLLLAVLLASAGLLGAAAYDSISHDPRWQSMADKVRIGLEQERPEQVLCEGLSAADEARIRQEFAERAPNYADELINGLKIQDGGRIMLMRVGAKLVGEHPLGVDGGRGAYKKIIEAKCGHVPALGFAHLHQSWMDLALALGWVGAGLFAWLLLSFARTGWQGMRRDELRPWAMALFLVSVFWFLRGFADSLYREHYLQMQALLLAYLFGRMNLAHAAISSNFRA